MFSSALKLNGDISSWDVSNVTTMESMFFRAEDFNGDISSWDVSSVTNMSDMFYATNAFFKDLSAWDISSVTNMTDMFRFGKLTTIDNIFGPWDAGSKQYSTPPVPPPSPVTYYGTIDNSWNVKNAVLYNDQTKTANMWG